MTVLAQGGSLTELVLSNSPSWRIFDSSAISIARVPSVNTVPGTYERIPTAPHLSNHLTFQVSAVATTLGFELTEALPLLGCALLSTDTNADISSRIFYSDISLVLESWHENARPSSLRMKFVFKNTKHIVTAGRYCVQMVYNNWLINLNCNNAVIFVDVFHLPL